MSDKKFWKSDLYVYVGNKTELESALRTDISRTAIDTPSLRKEFWDTRRESLLRGNAQKKEV